MRFPIFLSILFLSLSVRADHGPFGLGVIIGGPTGISAKYDLDSERALDGAVAWSFGGRTRLHTHMDFLWKRPAALNLDRVDLDFYYGVGGRLITRDADEAKNKTLFGVRGPVGLSYRFEKPSLEIFAELAFYMNLVSETEAGADGGIGIRYLF